MKILAVDTSCMMGSVALLEDGALIAEQLLNIQLTHSERLLPSIEGLLEAAGLRVQAVDGFAVAIGPGSFTGLRIGLAAIKGLAFASRRPVVGISTLKALSYNMFGTTMPIVSVLDARRGEFYVGVNRFDGEDLVGMLEDTVMPPERLLLYLSSLKERVAFVGDGVYSLKTRLEGCLGDMAIIPPPGMIHPRASNVAYLGLKRIKAGDVDDVAALKPCYIRVSDAEMK